ncbi:MAG: hypothetical protein ACREMV_07875, partial [Gemmatimonadales bacterium]
MSPIRSLLALPVACTLAVAACSDDGGTQPPPPGPAAAVLTGDITASRTLDADTVYTLSGYVKVKNGAVLTIPAGTKIVGDTTAAGSSLWILRGSRIVANGTAAAPIVFTSARAAGNRAPGGWG